MGTPIPPNEPGESCSFCFGPGKIWDGQPTPKFVTMHFYGWMPGASYESRFEQTLLSPLLLQQTIWPCAYFLKVGDLEIGFEFAALNSNAYIFAAPYLTPYFFGYSNNPCELVIASDLIESGGDGTYGGWFSVSWNPEDLL